MEKSVVFTIVAIVMLALIPIVPKMMSLRIKVLRILHLNWFANLHERHFSAFVLGVRITLVAAVIVSLVVGLS